MNIHLLLGLLVLVTLSECSDLPSYIKPCSRGEKFEECALESAKYAIPHIVAGDKSLKIPSMKPLHILLIEVDTRKSFKLRMEDVDVYGLEHAVPVAVKTDFEKRVLSVSLKIENVTLIGKYDINGKIMVLPITGKGPCKITLEDGIYTFNAFYNLEERDGKRYAKLDKMRSDFNYKLENVHYVFENLFNGDKLLGEQMNKFMNENWREVDKDLNKSISEAFLQIYSDISEKFYSKLPFDELFPK